MKPEGFGDLPLLPLLHSEHSAKLTIATDGDVIKGTVYLTLECVDEGVSVKG